MAFLFENSGNSLCLHCNTYTQKKETKVTNLIIRTTGQLQLFSGHREQGLEGYFWGSGFDQNTVQESGKR